MRAPIRRPIIKLSCLTLFAFMLGASYFNAQAVLTNRVNLPIMAAGAMHSVMLKADGTVWVWGNDTHSHQFGGAIPQFPDDATFSRNPSIVPNLLGAVAVAAGSYHSLVLKYNGTVLAFGENGNGQLGMGDSAVRTNAALIPGLTGVDAIEAGEDFSMAVLQNGAVKSFGNNSNGQLGIGNTTQMTSPTSVLSLTNAVAVACGYRHALALTSSGTVWGWGHNAYGEVGDGSTSQRTSPVLIPGFSGVIGVAAGEDYSLALKTNGTVWVWGRNVNGRLGIGSVSGNLTSPTNIFALSNICMIRAGSQQGYAVDTSGKLWVWGNNGATASASGNMGFTLGFPQAGIFNIPTQQVALPNLQFIGGSGPKLFSGNTTPRHFSSALYNDGLVRHWGQFVLASGGNPLIVTTNIDWGYTSTVTGSCVYPTAYSRGSTNSADFASFVIPLDFQQGQAFSNIGGNATNLLPFVTNSAQAYHFNFTNSLSNGQTNLSLRIPYQNPIVGFGSRVGGSTLYTERSYRFVTFGGCPAMTNDYPFLNNYTNALTIDVYSRTNFAFIGSTNLPIPFYLSTNGSWATFLTNGLHTSLMAFGLETTLSTRSYPAAYGVTNNGELVLEHLASSLATNYIFVVKLKGQNGFGNVAILQDLTPAWQPIYTLEFEPAPAWNIRFLSQIQFQDEPLPPFYDGKSLEELLTNSWAVTNIVQLGNPISSYTNLDQSPELRQHPALDRFVDDLKHDPMALARFVQNEIELTDAIDYVTTNQITAGQLNLAGVNRSALGTFLERQGSPVEQCALLIYLLRRAGVPAVYALPPTNGVKMLDARLSKMLRAQLNKALDPNSLAMNTNALISVNYPWVAAYINNQWIHLFPWIKDTEIIEGPNLYDFMPAAYDDATKWLVGYLFNRPEIVGLGDANETPEVLFQRYVKQQLQANAPGVSLDECGIRAVNRQKAFNSWDEFPKPTWVSGTNWTADTLSDSLLTNSVFHAWNPFIFPPNNIFNEARIQVTYFGTNIFDTQILRSCDLHDRPLLVFSERTNTEPIRFKMMLAAYRPSATNASSFTNDPALLNPQTLLYTFPVNNTLDVGVQVNLTRYRVFGPSDVIQRTMPIQKGDLTAICLNFGRVTKEMLEPLATTVWNVERQIKQNPSITNSLTADQHQGPLTYLMGMAYYEKVNRFIPINAQLHSRSPVITIAIGSSKLIAQKDSGTATGLPAGIMNYIQPSVDMVFNERFTVEAPTARPDNGENLNLANDSFNILAIADSSAKEHDIINSFFNQADAISTVKLLQLANQRHATNAATYQDIVVVNPNNFNALSTNTGTYFAQNNNRMDPDIWAKVAYGVLSSPENQAFVTPGSISNYTGSYKGTGALIIDRRGSYSALISGAGNGGWGSTVPDFSFADINLANVWLDISGSGDYSVTYSAPSSTYKPFAYDSFDPAQTLDVYNYAHNGYYSFTTFNNQWGWQSSGYLGLSTTGLGFKDVYANDVLSTSSRSFLGWLSDALGQMFAAVKDPVHALTGEFYVDTVDLTLVGPLPLEIRRNYSSLNTADNQFGIGWKISFTPYISIATNSTVMYVAEPNGSVLAYEPAVTNANFWYPTLLRNPELVNNRREGVGSVANLFLSKIVQTNILGITNYYLYSPNGDIRIYEVKPFNIANVVDRTRPYLTKWTDNRGNYLSFSYGTNSQETDYSELRRVDSGSGGYIQFRYDIYGHIVDALAGDGREIKYQYDDFGDLVKVILSDASELAYDYQHSTQSVTNNGKVTQEPYSMHLITLETKPEGRLIANAYDTQRRVLTQAATCGTDLNLVTNATFVYSNNFVLTNFFTNTLSGYTTIADVFGKITRYDYTNSRITLVTDPLQQTIEQDWYDENPGLPGYYPRSVWKTKDKRGLWTEFKYDASGNVTNVITTGSLTGVAGTQTATNAFVYNSNNLPIVTIDAIGNSNVVRYDPFFIFLPKEVVAYKQGQPLITNELVFGNATNVVTMGNAIWTNTSFGMITLGIRAFNSPDAATNEWRFNGGGFLTNETDYTSTTDPAISNSLSYNGRGQLFQRIDAAGRSSRYDYDGLGRMISEEDFETGQSTPLSWLYSYYNRNGEITWRDGPQYDPEDYVWFDYDGAGRKTAEVHWRSRAKADGSGVEAEPESTLYSISSLAYDPFGNQTNQTDPVGNFSVMAYDAIGQMTQQVLYATDGTSLATNRMSHEAGGEVSNFTNSLGGVTQTLYTQTGKPYFRQNPDGSTNGWQYDLLGRTVKEFQPNGSYWETTFDELHFTVARQFKDASGTVLASTTNILDRRGNVITNIAAEGGTFFSVYDGLDRVKISGGPATVSGISTQQLNYTYYDNAGIFVTNKDSLGRQTVTQSDAIQRPVLTEIHDALNGNTLVFSQAMSYSSDHHRLLVTTGTGSSAISNATFADSFASPVLYHAYPSTGITNYSITRYDPAGRATQTQDELGQTTTFTYDGLSRLKTKQLPDGATVTNTYNSEGGLVSMAMPGGLTWSGVYNSANQRTFEQLSNGASVARQFTNSFYSSGPLAGLVQSSIDLGRSVTNTFVYDAWRRVNTNLASGLLPEHTLLTRFQFDARGLVTNYFQSSGINPTTVVSHRYDSYGQLTNEQIAIVGVVTNTLTQEWSAAGRRSALIAPTAEFNYGYRVDGLMSSVSAFGATCSFNYGNNGLLAARNNPWRQLAVNSRDGQGRLLQQTTTLGLSTALVENLSWRPNSTISGYSATRGGTGAWNESRDYQYNSRDQLTAEPVGLTTGTKATNYYGFDGNKLGVLTSIQLTGGLTNNWQAVGLNPLAELTGEAWNQSGLTLRAGGSAVNASSVLASLDGGAIGSSLSGGRWYSDLNLSPGSHTLAASASYNAGQYAATATSAFTVVGNNNVTNFYDSAGNVTNRLFANGKSQALAWDALGRLVSVLERNNGTNGFNWTAIYDALGRRLETVQVPVVNNAANTAMALVIDSWFDPQVEFGEIGVAINGRRTWKIVGPDGHGGFGTMQGVGGLEATVRESDLQITPVLNDFSGNVLATTSGTTANWNPVRVGGYGPEIGYQSPALTPGTPLAETMVWRSRRIDPTGFYWLGARHYDPMAGRFLTPDPLGHGASMDLYSFADGDPVNRFDPDGRFGKDLAYGAGDAMGGGSYYESFLNPRSLWSRAAYDIGWTVAEGTKQLALYFATEGAFSLLSRGLGFGAEALSAELSVERAALSEETALARTSTRAFEADTDMSALFAAKSGEGGLGSAESSAGKFALGTEERLISSSEMEANIVAPRGRPWVTNRPEKEPDKFMPISKSLYQEEIDRFREVGLRTLGAFPGRAGLNPKSPLFISKPNFGGGRVWFSTYEVNVLDSAHLVVNGLLRGERVLFLSGAHGYPERFMEPFPGIIASEKEFFRAVNIDVEIKDVMRLSNSQLRAALNRDGRVICSWCFSAHTYKNLEALWGLP